MEEAKIWKVKDSPVVAFRGKPGISSFILYAGPKEYDSLKALHVGLENIIDFGFFSIIALPLFWILKLFYKLIGNYGWSISASYYTCKDTVYPTCQQKPEVDEEDAGDSTQDGRDKRKIQERPAKNAEGDDGAL